MVFLLMLLRLLQTGIGQWHGVFPARRKHKNLSFLADLCYNI